MKYFVAALLLLFVSEAFAADPLVYVRCERTTTEFTLTRDITLGGSTVSRTRSFPTDILDQAMDVTEPLGDNISAPCDLVTRDALGVETVIHDCSTTGGVVGQPTCAALDPVVSFDGTKIYYALYKGTLEFLTRGISDRVLDGAAESPTTISETLPNKKLSSEGAHIRVYNTTNSTSADITPYVAGLWDTAPVQLPNGRIAFTTTQGNNWSNVIFRTSTVEKNIRIAAVDEMGGGNREILTYDVITQVQHPIILKNGKLLYSSWEVLWGIPFEHPNGTPGSSTTTLNLFKIWESRADGSVTFPVLGQHSLTTGVTSSGKNPVALHFFAEYPNGDICSADYYRGNSQQASGAIICFTPEAEGIEGQDPLGPLATVHDKYWPSNSYNLTPWSITGDTSAKPNINFPADLTVTHPNYVSPLAVTGKVGFPAALPNGDSLLTWSNGLCGLVLGYDHFTALGKNISEIAAEFVTGNGQGVSMNNVRWLRELMVAQGIPGGDVPGCDMDIVKLPAAKFGNSTSPKDFEIVVASKDWHFSQVRYWGPYTDIFGISAPPVTEMDTFTSVETPFGRLGWASITDREIFPRGGLVILDETLIPSHVQGTQTVDNLTDDEICGIRILTMHPNDNANAINNVVSTLGHYVDIFAEIYSKNYNGANQILDINGNPDTSGYIEIPANMPFTMQGIDCLGRTLSVDQRTQSLKPREERTCNGCHLHSRAPLLTWPQSYAAQQDNPVLLGRGTVPLLIGESSPGVPVYDNKTGYGYTIEYTADIIPIFQSRCNSCHTSGNAGGGLILDEYALAHNFINATTGQYSTYAALAWDRDQVAPDVQITTTAGTRFGRPYLSKYIFANNSRRSLLYWKAKGERTDNWTDSTHTTDIDYGAVHPATGITDAELGTLSRWIDIGMPYKLSGGSDKIEPSLTIGATVIDNAGNPEISQLHIGTVDASSGINTATLSVTVNSGANIAPTANPNGTVTINLGTNITSGTDIISATVDDVAGNTTTLTRTADFFLGAGAAALSMSACADQAVDEGSTYLCAVIVNDGQPPYDYVINWGDGGSNDTGQTSNNSFNISRLFPDGPVVRTVNVSVTDATLTNVQDNIVITVLNKPATGSINVTAAGTVGVPYVINYNINDPGQDTYTITVDWGDGTINNLTSHTYSTSGQYSVIFNAIDEDGISITQRHTVTISD